MDIDKIKKCLKKYEIKEINKLAGDASDRTFYRILLKNKESIVAMCYLKGSDDAIKRWIDINLYMKGLGLKVPEVYSVNDKSGVVIIQDFGDVTLEKYLFNLSEDEILKIYLKAVENLIVLQNGGKKRELACFHLAFDTEKLFEELLFFVTHTIEGYWEIKVKEKDKSNLNKEFMALSSFLAGRERVLTHRDYHSRNLMSVNGELGIVDFQDARLGPCQYDLASLLRDSYFQLDEAVISVVLKRYFENCMMKKKENFEEFLKVFDYMSLQRNLKALGSFGFLSSIKKKTYFGKYMPATISYVMKNLQKYSELKNLADVLIPYLQEGLK